MVGGAVADLVDSRYPIIDVVPSCSFRPCLVNGRNPQIAFVATVCHMRPKAQSEVRDDVVRRRILAEAASQMVDGISVQPVCIVDLPSLVPPEDRAPCGRLIVEQPVVRSAPSRGYRFVVCVSEGDLKERNVLQNGLRKAYVPKVKIECD